MNDRFRTRFAHNKYMVNVAIGFDASRCMKALASIETDLNQLASLLTEAQFHAPPRTGGWSVGYCIEHLVLTGEAFLQQWEIAVKEAAAKHASGNGCSSYGWWHRRLLRFLEPPYRLKTKATQPLVPCSRRPKEDTVRRFFTMHQEFAGKIASSRGLDVKRVKIQSPFASWLRYPLGFSFDLALAHERRHLWQAWQVRRQLMDQL